MLRRFNLRKRRPSIKTFHVVLLDGTKLTLNLDTRSHGRELLDRVLQESGVTSDKVYFSLAVQEEDYLKWLLLNKPLKKQLPGHSPYTVLFRVHIYPHNHHSMLQSLSRHFLYLQIKQDLQMSRLQPSSNTMTNRIAALVVQGEIGNFIPHLCTNGYIKELQILPNMPSSVEEAIKQAHRLNRGRLPGDCEEEVLDLVQDEPSYGSYCYSVQDAYRQPVTLCICPEAVRVSQSGRQVACFKWELIVKVYHRSKHLYLNMDTTQALPVYEAHYICRNTAMAQNIAIWCQTLLSFYCTPILLDNSKSRLRRFFSSRRSLRRQPNQIRAQFGNHSSSLQGRNRRASVGGESSSRMVAGDNSQDSPGRLSFMKRQPKRTDSNLVIYGLSGLASPPEEESPSHDPSHSVISPASLSESPFMLPDNSRNSYHSDTTPSESMEKDRLGRISHSSALSLHGIQERSENSLALDSSDHGSRIDTLPESGIGSSETPAISERYSGRGLTSPLEVLQENPPRRNLYASGASRQQEPEESHWGSRTGEDSDLEHKTIDSILQEKQGQPSRFMPSGDFRESPSAPPLPPRTFSPGDLSIGEDEFSDSTSGRARENLPLPLVPSVNVGVMGSRGVRLHQKNSTPQHHSQHSHPGHTSSSSHTSSKSHPAHYFQQGHHKPANSHQSGQYNRKQGGGDLSRPQRRSHQQQFSLSQPSPTPYGHTHPFINSSSSREHQPRPLQSPPTYPNPHGHPISSNLHPSREHHPSQTYSYQRASGGGRSQMSEREDQKRLRQWRDSRGTSSSTSSPVTYAHDQSYDADQSQDSSSVSLMFPRGSRVSSESTNVPPVDPRSSDLRYSYRAARRYSYDEDSVLPKREAVISPGGTPSSHHMNGRGLLLGVMDSAKPNHKDGSDHSSSHHYQALRKGQQPSPRSNGAWQEEEVEIVPPTSTSLPLHSNPDYSLYEEDEELEGEGEVRENRRADRPRAGSMQETASLHEGGWHVPRHKRLRHSTITSLTSLSHSDIIGGLSRLGSIASLDHQANLAELSQTDSIGYFDPHVRSFIFEASQNSQGTEL